MRTSSGYRWVLLVVVLGYVGLTLAVTDLHRYLAYDEAIYLSQVYPGPALPFTAPRARGLPLLLYPLGRFDASVPAIRCYLLAVEAALMYLSFNAWLPVLRRRAVIAAAVFSVAWLPLFYATEAFPNLPVAFAVVAAAGYLARYLTGVCGRRALVGCSVAVAAVALLRPTEALLVTAGLCLAAAARPGAELALRWGLPILGLMLGSLPWLIEGQVRFGGPLQRLRAASANVGGGFHPGNVRQHLDLTGGSASSGRAGGSIGSGLGAVPWPGVIWWALLAVAVVVLVVRVLTGQADRVQRAGAVAAVVGVASASPYLFLTQVQEARFLLPAYAALTLALVAAVPDPSPSRTPSPNPTPSPIPVPSPIPIPNAGPSPNAGPPSRRRGRAARPVSVALATALFVVFAGWQIGTARRVETQQVAARTLGQRLVNVVRRQSSPPCVVAGEVAFPVIAFGSECRGAPFRPDSPDITVAVGPNRSAMPPVYVLTSTDPARTGVRPVPGSVRSLAADGVPGWWLFIATPEEVFAAS